MSRSSQLQHCRHLSISQRHLLSGSPLGTTPGLWRWRIANTTFLPSANRDASNRHVHAVLYLSSSGFGSSSNPCHLRLWKPGRAAGQCIPVAAHHSWPHGLPPDCVMHRMRTQYRQAPIGQQVIDARRCELDPHTRVAAGPAQSLCNLGRRAIYVHARVYTSCRRLS